MWFVREYGYPIEVIRERFWLRVEKTDTCWEWIGRTNEKGYGLMQVKPSGCPHQTMTAHRLSYQLLVGPIPDGLTLDHLCRNTSCVNPEHLEPVTLEENVRRAHPIDAQCGACGAGVNHIFPRCAPCWKAMTEEERRPLLWPPKPPREKKPCKVTIRRHTGATAKVRAMLLVDPLIGADAVIEATGVKRDTARAILSGIRRGR